MKIAIGFEIYDTKETPILIQFDPQDRLDIIGIPSNKNVFIMSPNNMPSESIDKWAQDVMARLVPKSVDKKEKLWINYLIK